ncbi:MAG TPA: PAS domain-containing sensor histidine kinase [Acidimicrobiales bacterium]|nr:PAS domain-containing sensor histidine kinase [Acidimicrobiales bacterium]
MAVRAPDELTIAAVAWLRVGIAVGAAAAGSIPADLSGRHTLLFVLIGLVWVPWSVLVLFASERPGTWVRWGAPTGDLAVLFAVQALAPGGSEAVLAGYVVVIAFAAATAGRAVAGALAGAAIALSILAHSLADQPDRLNPAVLVLFVVATAAIVLLIDRTSSLHARATARAAHLQSTADAVLAHIADGVVVTDPAGAVLACNPASERILGLPAAALVGQSCAAALDLHIEQRALDCSDGCRLLTEPSATDASLGHEVWRAAGSRRQPLLANVTPIRGDDGAVVEVVHSLRDITRLKQSEEAKTLFLATASHELKTPLTVIRGFVETLLKEPLDEGGRQLALDAVHRRAIELSSIVDRLLLSSRIEAGRVELTLTVVDVVEILEERVLALAAARERVVDLHVEPGVGLVHGDAAALATVFEHLIDNAIKYSPEGGPITVDARGGERTRVVVSDRGIGMDAEELALCFDKFWQAESTDVRRFGGTGIGLYIVRSLVEAMNGRLTARSSPGAGSSFTVELLSAGTTPDAGDERAPGTGESTMIREFMRQIGVPEREAP